MLHFTEDIDTEFLTIHKFVIGSFAVNTMVIVNKITRDAAVIDPGGEAPKIAQFITDHNYKVRYFLLTHGHIDHVTGLGELKMLFPDAPVCMHSLDLPVIEYLPHQCVMFGVPLVDVPKIDIDLAAHPDFELGNLKCHSILTPGHTPGSVCFHFADQHIIFTGDLLFKGSVGRTDFEGGSGSDLKKSLTTLIELLPDDTRIYPGHGKPTIMSTEKATNFYLKIDKWR